MKSNKNVSKLFSCVFFKDVLCSFRKYESSGIMDRCFRCRHFERFMREKAEEEEEFWEEEERVLKYGRPVDARTLMDVVEFHMANFCWFCARRLDDVNSSDVQNVCRRCKHTFGDVV